MAAQQDWQTESYKGMDIFVTALPHEGSDSLWDYTVRIAWPGEDVASDEGVVGKSGDDGDYPSREAAVQAGLQKGYALVDQLGNQGRGEAHAPQMS